MKYSVICYTPSFALPESSNSLFSSAGAKMLQRVHLANRIYKREAKVIEAFSRWTC